MESKEDFQERKKLCYDGWFYSVQRIDLLIITISGAGVYVILETLKSSLESPIKNIVLLKYAGVLFIASIIVNFISQFTGQKANYFDMVYCKAKLCADEVPTNEQQENILKQDKKASVYNKLTNASNVISMLIMFIALAVLVKFFWITF